MPKIKEDINETEVLNPKNEKIVQEFEKLISQIKIQIENAPTSGQYVTNHFRLKQITNAIQIIKLYAYEIKSGNDLKEYKGIGKGTISRIDEILKSGKLSEIKTNKKEEKYAKYIKELQEVYGIGQKTAYNFVSKYNIKSVDALKKAYNEGTIDLPNQIIVGLKYYKVYEENIHRSEIDKISDYLTIKVKAIDKNLDMIICGSYRRLKPFSNDIDVLLSHPKVKTKLQLSTESGDGYLVKLVRKLKEDKFLLDDLTDKDYETKYMGFCKLKGDTEKYPVRRIDIRYIPSDSYYTSTLHFTGSAQFNQKIRGLAEQLGYLLNEYGLYQLGADGKRKRLKINSEKDVFDELGLEYIPPEKRN